MWLKKLFQNRMTLNQLPVEHDWELISRTYSAPRRDVAAIASLNLDPTVLQKALTGVTTYLWQCKNTGEIRTEELLGSDKDELEELVNKVDLSGMQYIRMNDNVYAIAKWVPPKDGSEPRVPLK